ncbi:ACP S-malonyltransferase [Mixta intestinalis]|uniref:Malonyl CoA-acyl carrier protein transacylase n=1 Tax=Mixta intestinalis TaxID=1615494 RepID=A0A6P1PVN2_9GAMM|nr:ACP S-malonyltransferase [Mixta intestinalis]QHM70566.1 Malonyl CoA-acyl carrier protein transacylase [Mixta intestinalis]
MDININSVSRPIVLLFAGQGNPVIGMGADLWDINVATRHIWDCASDISGLDLRRLCLKGPMNKLIQTTVQQLAVTAINLTLYTLIREKLASCTLSGACGHSVGEYGALYAAEALSLEDTFRVIHFRSTLMNTLSKMNKGSMLAVKGMDYLAMCKRIENSGIELDVSCDNSRRQQVVGGAIPALSEFNRSLVADGFEAVKLGVSGAWHTRLMRDGVQQMHDFLTYLPIEQPQYDVLMNVTGKPEDNPEAIRKNLSQHLTHTVKWTDSLERFLAQETPPLFIEISNKAYLGQLLNDFPRFSPAMVLHCRKII